MDFDAEIEKQRIKNDPQEAEIFCYCDRCNQEIYVGNSYYLFQNLKFNLCENCFDELQDMEKKESERIAGEDNE